MEKMHVDTVSELALSALISVAGGMALKDDFKKQWKRITRDLSEVEAQSAGDLVIGALKTAMNSAGPFFDERAILIAHFCNEWNGLVGHAGAHRRTEPAAMGARKMKKSSQDIYYELNCGQPVLHRGGVPVSRPLDRVGIAYDDSDEVICLHKYGDIESVQKWVQRTREALLKSGGALGTKMANNIKFIEIVVPMPPRLFPVDLLNDAIEGNRKALAELIARESAIDAFAVGVSVKVSPKPKRDDSPSPGM